MDTCKIQVVRRTSDGRVVGFHGLASSSIEPASATTRVREGTGRYPIPVALLARMGIDLEEQGEGLGRSLMVDVLRRVNAAADHIAIRALLIHAKDDEAKRFYEHLAEFEESPTDPLHLLLAIQDLRASLPSR